MPETILGISAYYHDSAAAIVRDGQVVAAVQEERLSRKKHDPRFPARAVGWCLSECGLRLEDLSAIVFYDKPFLKFERLMESYRAFSPRGLASFVSSMPVWVREKLFLGSLLKRELSAFGTRDWKKSPLLFSEHHLSHAASAFYPSPFTEAAILTIDGVGEWATASICKGGPEGLRLLRELHFPHSVGLLYSAFTYFLGFKVNSGEYKLMGLAPYGDPQSPRVARFRELILSELVDVAEDGSIWLNQDRFTYATGLRMVSDSRWERLFGFARREPEQPLEQRHCDLALAIQQVTEEIVLRMARTAQALTGARNLCLAGGVALNCVANGKLLREKIFDRIWIQPAAGDAGGALGAAFCGYHLSLGRARTKSTEKDGMRGAFLGPSYSESEVGKMISKRQAAAEHFTDFAELSRRVARSLAEGRVVGWFQGAAEWGPRALGNRSILADARNPEMQKRLNLKIKYREGFRPFAPSVLAEDRAEHFELSDPSPYMLLVANVRKDRCRELPSGYHQMDVQSKLYFQRSHLPAITHIDFSARVQTVHAETNPRFHALLRAFKDATGCGALVNTSFNVRGEPIVCSPEDAYRCFMATEMDVLVIGDYLFEKGKQP